MSDECKTCWGRGWYPEPYGEADQWGVQDVRERYCDCEAGRRRQRRERGDEDLTCGDAA